MYDGHSNYKYDHLYRTCSLNGLNSVTPFSSPGCTAFVYGTVYPGDEKGVTEFNPTYSYPSLLYYYH